MNLREKLFKARIRVIQEHGEFYARILCLMESVIDKEIPTTAIRNSSTGKYDLLIGEDFLRDQTEETVASFIVHEINHADRLFSDRAKKLCHSEEDHQIFNIAQDIVINPITPGMPKTLKDGKGNDMRFCWPEFFTRYGIKDNSTSELNFSSLYAKKDKLKLQTKDKWTIVRDGSGKDIHSPCQPLKFKDKASEEIFKQQIKQIAQQSKGRGTIPGGWHSLLKWLNKPQILWKQQLRNFVSSSYTPEKVKSWRRTSRRYEFAKGAIKDVRPKIILVVDTSGSVGDEQLKQFLAEMHSIYTELKTDITVIECDMQVQKVSQYNHKIDKKEFKFHGRGGTSFKPPFEYVDKHNLKPDGLIYFTDLEGDFPKKPRYPVLWASTTKHKAPFGRTVYIEVEEQ